LEMLRLKSLGPPGALLEGNFVHSLVITRAG